MAAWLNISALVVDDSASMRASISEALERAGARTVVAVDGADAWKQLQGMRVDLVVTDIHMPVMDGLKLIHLVRSGGVHRDTPIIVVTAETQDRDRRRAMALGASVYLVKPVDTDELIETARDLVGAEDDDA